MFPSQNPNVPFDPNTQRAIEELAFVLNDVEQRLHLIRMNIAQAMPTPGWHGFGAQFPQAPGLFPVPSAFGFGANVPSIQTLLANPVLLHQFLAANVAKLHTGGIPAAAYGAIPSFGGISPFGSPVGVSAPFGIQSPFQAPFAPFRF